MAAGVALPVPISPATAGKEIGGKSGVLLVLLGVLHLTHKALLSPNQIHSDSSRFVLIHSFQLEFTQSHPDPPNLNQICSDSHRFLQSHTDLLTFMQFHTDSFRFTEFYTVS